MSDYGVAETAASALLELAASSHGVVVNGIRPAMTPTRGLGMVAITTIEVRDRQKVSITDICSTSFTANTCCHCIVWPVSHQRSSRGYADALECQS